MQTSTLSLWQARLDDRLGDGVLNAVQRLGVVGRAMQKAQLYEVVQSLRLGGRHQACRQGRPKTLASRKSSCSSTVKRSSCAWTRVRNRNAWPSIDFAWQPPLAIHELQGAVSPGMTSPCLPGPAASRHSA